MKLFKRIRDWREKRKEEKGDKLCREVVDEFDKNEEEYIKTLPFKELTVENEKEDTEQAK